ncbi:MAG: excinuclease ABC subunit UvrC [Bacteroidetes bacterium]|nr:excinuclease ABC subunit UvrC [Bacteroidota bacterium]
MTPEKFKDIATTLPKEPGVYRYYDAREKLLYVGKAKNLKNRISSYFTDKQISHKTRLLVSRIERIEYTIVQSEADALFLENTLIKQHRPVFNIELKDDKGYPYIVIKNESFPRIFLTRRKLNDGSEYLGPFASAGKVRELITFIKQYLPIRNCNLQLTPKNIAQKKFKSCLEYQLGNCKAPCVGLQSEADYQDNIEQIKYLLNGNLQSVIQFLKAQMKQYAAELSFEKAAIVKNKIEYLENYRSKSTVVNAGVKEADVFYLLREDEMIFVNYLMVRNSTVIQSESRSLPARLEESDAELLSMIIHEWRMVFKTEAKEIILPFSIEWFDAGVHISIPKKGVKKQLLDMSRLNAQHLLQQYKKQKSLLLAPADQDHTELLREVKEALHLPEIPGHIECFDNSNFQGSYPVSAMVCFKDGKASKGDYRKFNIKTVEGINDFASMAEAVYRRYHRLKTENLPFPQLLIIDGGKGQLSAALESLKKLDLTDRMTVVGLAKNKEEIFFPGDSQSLQLPLDSPVLLFIRSIRDEVHRFGLRFHREKRSVGTFKNQLTDIAGIGEATVKLLYTRFKSMDGIRKAEVVEINKLIGEKKGMLIQQFLKEKGAG